MSNTASTAPAPVRANMLLTGDDATLWVGVCSHILHRDGKLPTNAVIIRDALRCYAEKLNVTAK